METTRTYIDLWETVFSTTHFLESIGWDFSLTYSIGLKLSQRNKLLSCLRKEYLKMPIIERILVYIDVGGSWSIFNTTMSSASADKTINQKRLLFIYLYFCLMKDWYSQIRFSNGQQFHIINSMGNIQYWHGFIEDMLSFQSQY